MNKKLVCKYCGRMIPNKEHRTKYGCKFCDYRYWQKKQKMQTLDTNNRVWYTYDMQGKI